MLTDLDVLAGDLGHFPGRSTSAICESIRDAGTATEFNSYDLAMNDHGEIVLNLPHVVAALCDGCVWELHDTSASNAADLLRMSTARLVTVVDTLGISGSKYVLQWTKADNGGCAAVEQFP